MKDTMQRYFNGYTIICSKPSWNTEQNKKIALIASFMLLLRFICAAASLIGNSQYEQNQALNATKIYTRSYSVRFFVFNLFELKCIFTPIFILFQTTMQYII